MRRFLERYSLVLLLFALWGLYVLSSYYPMGWIWVIGFILLAAYFIYVTIRKHHWDTMHSGISNVAMLLFMALLLFSILKIDVGANIALNALLVCLLGLAGTSLKPVRNILIILLLIALVYSVNLAFSVSTTLGIVDLFLIIGIVVFYIVYWDSDKDR